MEKEKVGKQNRRIEYKRLKTEIRKQIKIKRRENGWKRSVPHSQPQMNTTNPKRYFNK